MAVEIDAGGLTAQEVQQALDSAKREKSKEKSVPELFADIQKILMRLYPSSISGQCRFPECAGDCAFNGCKWLCPVYAYRDKLAESKDTF